jgi:hypothetical protein
MSSESNTGGEPDKRNSITASGGLRLRQSTAVRNAAHGRGPRDGRSTAQVLRQGQRLGHQSNQWLRQMTAIRNVDHCRGGSA